MSKWFEKEIDGVLLDITGVLYESGGGPIPGSVEAVQRLKASDKPVRFCTNETTVSRKMLIAKLSKMGFDLEESEVFPPIPAVCKVLKQRNLRPLVIACPDAMADFSEVELTNPNCVVLADAHRGFSYENMNKAFQLLMSLDKPVLFALGKGKYYKDDGQLVLDVGAYSKALEFACDIEAEVVGKPSPTFFRTALDDMGIAADKCVMIGDDIVGDVGGAQSAGMRGVQVRTGKYRIQDENHPVVKADGFVDNLAQAVDLILKQT